jgi:hypothetical protein
VPNAPDPADIQQQIEATRAELASTVDAIADRVNPKSVATRGAATLKGKFEDLRSRGTALGSSSNGTAAIAGPDGGQLPLPERVKAQLREAKETRGKSVRWDRVAIVAGVIALILVVKRSRSE